jgi:hypothetical protein
MELRRRAGRLLMIIAAASLLLAGYTTKPTTRAAEEIAPPTLAITPAANAKDVPISAEIGAAVTGGKITEVVLTDHRGAKVEGAMRADGSAWVPSKPAQAQAGLYRPGHRDRRLGKVLNRASTFTTMNKPLNWCKPSCISRAATRMGSPCR